MKPFTPELAALFDTNAFVSCDLYSFALIGGGTALLTSADTDILFDGNTYRAGAPLVARSPISQKTGLQVSSIKITLYPTANDTIEAVQWLSALRRGMFDGASVTIARAFAPSWGVPMTGAIVMMAGRVADSTFGRSKAEIEINSWTELLSNQMPRKYYQSGCNSTLGDASCGVNLAAYAQGGSIIGVDGGANLNTNLPTPQNWLTYGTLVMLTGICAGEKRPIRFNSGPFAGGSQVALQIPLSVPPAIGDEFVAYPGCDKTFLTCLYKFGNLENFSGFPFTPAPETAV